MRKTLDLEVDEVEVKVLTSLASVAEITVTDDERIECPRQFPSSTSAHSLPRPTSAAAVIGGSTSRRP